ncbi:methylenetetrahydrofolate reductase [Cuniculiplasma sp. SKW4]|uniref:methylenetetrahydrofolate reductase n=1 Tax=Cuniculiplasma sp. SKW4 TaxID=3400171 RepID=UPI003FD402E0
MGEKVITELKIVKSVEILPEKNLNNQDLDIAARNLDGAANVITAPENPGGRPGVDPFLTTKIVSMKIGAIAVPHITSRDKNRVYIISQIVSAIKNEIRNFFVIGGDPVDPKFSKLEVREIDALGIMREIRRIQNEQYAEKISINIGSAYNPYRDQEVSISLKKADAGADFFITQPIYSSEHLNPEIIAKNKLKIIPGFIPITRKGTITFLKKIGVNMSKAEIEKLRESDDIASTSRRMFLNTYDEIKGSVMGIHVMPMGDYKIAKEILESV